MSWCWWKEVRLWNHREVDEFRCHACKLYRNGRKGYPVCEMEDF